MRCRAFLIEVGVDGGSGQYAFIPSDFRRRIPPMIGLVPKYPVSWAVLNRVMTREGKYLLDVSEEVIRFVVFSVFNDTLSDMLNKFIEIFKGRRNDYPEFFGMISTGYSVYRTEFTVVSDTVCVHTVSPITAIKPENLNAPSVEKFLREVYRRHFDREMDGRVTSVDVEGIERCKLPEGVEGYMCSMSVKADEDTITLLLSVGLGEKGYGTLLPIEGVESDSRVWENFGRRVWFRRYMRREKDWRCNMREGTA